MEGTTIKSIFDKFTANAATMDGQTFTQFCQDTGIIGKAFTTTDADIIFAKVKGSSTVRTIGFAQFEKSVKEIAEKMNISEDDVKTKIVSSGGPLFSGTKTEAVQFHDDPNLYTGVHQGKDSGKKEDAPQTSTVQDSPATKSDSNKQQDAPKDIKKESITKETPPKKEQKKAEPQTSPSAFVVDENSAKEEKKKEETTSSVAPATKTSSGASTLQQVFSNFTGGAAQMEGKTFAKLIKDSGILDKKLTATDVDLIFTKVKKSDRKIKFNQFEAGLALISEQKEVSVESLTEKILSNGGPQLNATKPDSVKFHDDKSLYTGVHTQGGPSNVDQDNIKDLSSHTNRVVSDVRGVSQK